MRKNSHQTEKIEIIFERAHRNSEITEMKNSLEWLKSKFEQAEERVRELRYRSIETIQFEEETEKE